MMLCLQELVHTGFSVIFCYYKHPDQKQLGDREEVFYFGLHFKAPAHQLREGRVGV